LANAINARRKKMKKYQIQITKELINKLKPFWKKYETISNKYWDGITKLEMKMSKEMGIEEMEFFFVDNECAGIGNVARTMKLIQREKLQ